MYPSFLLLSAVFFLITIIYYSANREVSSTLIDKITVGYLVNNFLNFILTILTFAVRQWFEDYLLEFGVCEALGYLVLYTYLAFMFWINAMAANIFFRFSASMPQTSDDGFSKYFIYSQVGYLFLLHDHLMSVISSPQGFPLVIVISVYLVDQYGHCDWGLPLPSMGDAHCFLGHTWNTQRRLGSGGWTDFFLTPEFLYFHSIVLVLETANIVFFCLTIHSLSKHWRTTALLLHTETKTHFAIIFKLFLITGEMIMISQTLSSKKGLYHYYS